MEQFDATRRCQIGIKGVLEGGLVRLFEMQAALGEMQRKDVEHKRHEILAGLSNLDGVEVLQSNLALLEGRAWPPLVGILAFWRTFSIFLAHLASVKGAAGSEH